MGILERLSSAITTITGRDRLKHQLTQDPTQGYRAPSMAAVSDLFVNKIPAYTPRHGELMLRSDPMVGFAFNVRNAALMQADFEIKAKNPAVQKWLESQWDAIWNQNRTKVTAAKKYGYSALQIIYKLEENDILCIDRIKTFHPWHSRALEGRGCIAGAKIDGKQLVAPQVVWQTFGEEYDDPYGRGLLRRMFPPWFIKWMPHGSQDLGRLRMFKDAYLGDIFWYPENEGELMPDGTYRPWRDILREVAERRLSGGAMTLPLKLDSNGKELIRYQPPQAIHGGEAIWQWDDRNNKDILRGADVPLEVVEAQENGGFSGRSIPFMVVLATCQNELNDIVRSFVDMALRPIARLNWGGDPEFTITAKSLVESFAKDASGSSMGGSAIGSQQGQQPQQQYRSMPQQSSGAPVQFADESVQFESEPRWITIGGKKRGGKDHAGGFPVQIDNDGKILKGGPAGLRGRNVSEVGKYFDSQRSQKNREEYEKSPIGKSKSYAEIVKYQSTRWGVSEEFYKEVADQLWKHEIVLHTAREEAKASARSRLGLTQADINRLENQGFDHSSEHSKLKRVEAVGRDLASEYPELGWGMGYGDEDGKDYGENVWDLIKEGKQSLPSRLSREFHDEIDSYLESQLRNKGKKKEEPDLDFDFGANQFAADDDSSVDTIATIAVDQALERVRESSRLMQEALQRYKLFEPELMPSLENALKLSTGAIGLQLNTAMHGAAILGMEEVASTLPAALTPPNVPPTVPPLTMLGAGGADDLPPVSQFPIVNDAIIRLQVSPVATGANWRETAAKARQGAFAVTADIQDSAVARMRDLLAETIREGGGEDEFATKIRQHIFEAGPLSENHLRTIFRTNSSSSMSTGKEAAVSAPFVADAFPYRVYRATTDQRVRKEHIALEKLGLNGTAVYRADDPVWKEFAPPFDFGCRCKWSAITVGQAAKKGVQEAIDWVERAKAMAGSDDYHEYLIDTAPTQPQFVPHPPFSANPEFKRDVN